MRRTLINKRMLITGASSGIGRALAIAAGEQGCRLVLAARSEDQLAELTDDLNAQQIDATYIVTDVTNPDHRRRMFDHAVKMYDGLDFLVNNAGVAAHGHFVDLDAEILRETMELNFFSVAENCRLAIPILAEGTEPMIVNVSSMAGRRGVPAWSEYSASKFAVCGFSEALRAELVRFGIDLMLVVPGLTNSNFGHHLMARKGRLPAKFDTGVAPSHVAEKMLKGMQAGKHELRIEKDARLLLLVNWLAPRFVDWRMGKVVRKLYAKEIAERESLANKPAPEVVPFEAAQK